jgi:ribosomal protein L18
MPSFLLSEKEDTVPKWTLELNSMQAAAKNGHLIGHMLKVKRKVFYTWEGHARLLVKFSGPSMCAQVKQHTGHK